MPATAHLIADLGTVQVYRTAPLPHPIISALCSISLGAQNFAFSRSIREAKKASAFHPGIFESGGNLHEHHLEAFGETREAVEAAISNYVTNFPRSEWGTRFGFIGESYDGFRASGSRWIQQGWAA